MLRNGFLMGLPPILHVQEYNPNGMAILQTVSLVEAPGTHTPSTFPLAHDPSMESNGDLNGWDFVLHKMSIQILTKKNKDYHQQYLHKNPNGYCGLQGTGVE